MVTASDSCRIGHFGEGDIAVVVIEVALAAVVGIGVEEVVEAVVIVVADGDCGSAGGEHAEDIAVLAGENAGMMCWLDVRFGGDLFEADFRGAANTHGQRKPHTPRYIRTDPLCTPVTTQPR